MGSKLLNEEATTQKTYTEIFEESFPFYLAIGMSYAEYWEGDVKLAQYYRKAYNIKQDEINNNAWLQGMYIYDAFSTALFNFSRSLAKNPPAAKTYTQQPYDFGKRQKSEQEIAKEVESEQEKALAWMENFVRINQKYEPEP